MQPGIHASTRNNTTTCHNPTFSFFFLSSFLIFFIFFYIEHIRKLRILIIVDQKVHSVRSPFEVMAASTSSRSPISTSKEEAPLLGTRLPHHAPAAFHPTEAERVILNNGGSDILCFVGAMRENDWLFWWLFPHQWSISCLPHYGIGNGKFKTPVHEKRQQASSIFGIIKAAMCTTLPGQAGYLNSFL